MKMQSTPSVKMAGKQPTCTAPAQPQDKGITGKMQPRYTAQKSIPVSYLGA